MLNSQWSTVNPYLIKNVEYDDQHLIKQITIFFKLKKNLT